MGLLDDLGMAGFQKAGLDKILASWIGTGKNLPISADQIQKVLGAAALGNLASRPGSPPRTPPPSSRRSSPASSTS